MAGKIHIRRGKVPFFSLPFIALFAVAAVGLFAFFGVLALIALGVLGAGASVLRKLFGGRDGKTGPRAGGPGGDTITLGEDEYEIRDAD